MVNDDEQKECPILEVYGFCDHGTGCECLSIANLESSFRRHEFYNVWPSHDSILWIGGE